MDENLLRQHVQSFLREDIGQGDITSEAIFSAKEQGHARLVARQTLIAAGAATVAAEVFFAQSPEIISSDAVEDGREVQAGETMLRLQGPVLDMLKAERVALNLLQRLCGIATLTHRYVEKLGNRPVDIVDTRKTTPGLRMLEKYAVRAGGGKNHRFNLADGVLIKDNHIAACGSITDAVSRVRQVVPHTMRIEVETDTLAQVEECLQCGVDIIMLDNMEPAMLAHAVQVIGKRALVEASGGVLLEKVEEIAATGVDYISVGALTHSAASCDIGMDWFS